MARALEAGVRKHPFLRDDYPALRHIWTPFDPELHFRAWLKGATNLIWLFLCAERVYRHNQYLDDFFTFNEHKEVTKNTISERYADMSEGVAPPSPLLGPLRARFSARMASSEDSGEEDAVSSTSPDEIELQWLDDVIDAMEPAEQQGSEVIGEGYLTFEDVSGLPAVVHVEDPEETRIPEEPTVEHVEDPEGLEECSHVEQGDNTEGDWPLLSQGNIKSEGFSVPLEAGQSDRDVSEWTRQSRPQHESPVDASSHLSATAGPSSAGDEPAPSDAARPSSPDSGLFAVPLRPRHEVPRERSTPAGSPSPLPQDTHLGAESRASDDAPAQSEVSPSQNVDWEGSRASSPAAEPTPPQPQAAERDPEPEPEPHAETEV